MDCGSARPVVGREQELPGAICGEEARVRLEGNFPDRGQDPLSWINAKGHQFVGCAAPYVKVLSFWIYRQRSRATRGGDIAKMSSATCGGVYVKDGYFVFF
jgi:hypothetical protein